MPNKRLLTQQMVDMERRSRPDERKPKKQRVEVEPGIHPEDCLCGADHVNQEAGGEG